MTKLGILSSKKGSPNFFKNVLEYAQSSGCQRLAHTSVAWRTHYRLRQKSYKVFVKPLEFFRYTFSLPNYGIFDFVFFLTVYGVLMQKICNFFKVQKLKPPLTQPFFIFFYFFYRFWDTRLKDLIFICAPNSVLCTNVKFQNSCLH